MTSPNSTLSDNAESTRPQPNPAVLIPDLLDPSPTQRLDVERVTEAIRFAFASGVSGGLFADALERSVVGWPGWDRNSFAKDLFLSDFVERCLPVTISGRQVLANTGHISRLVGSPPTDRDVVQFRRGITAELGSSPQMRAELEKLYSLLCRFRTALEGATTGRTWDSNRRQLDLLAVAKKVFDLMTLEFAQAESGLARLSWFGARVKASDSYNSMQQLLAYDEHLATLDLKVRVGADGHIRGFEILALKENEQNVFTTSPWRRWLGKFELLARGFRFGEGEVMARLIDAVFEGILPELVHFVQLLGDLELYLGALGFRDLALASGLQVCLPELVGADEERVIDGLFNPLLMVHGTRPIPCDHRVDRHSTTVLVTGPNSGGKTRLLQSLGLAQVLAHTGIFVPARHARMALCPSLVVSLIQETTAGQSEGRLGTELVRVRSLFEHLPPGAMVILDELCSGTNPSEGEEIFELVVGMLTKLKPQAFITTHFLAFAAKLEQERKIADLRFFQVDLDQHQQPTYQFVRGVARTSLAQRAAERLGVTGEQLLVLVERNVAMAGRNRQENS